MALVRRDKRVYLYQTERKEGRRTTRYVARGPEAEALAAALEAVRIAAALDRFSLRQKSQAEIGSMVKLDAEIDCICEGIDLLARAILIVAGFHNLKGKLRRKRYGRQTTRNRNRRQSANAGSEG
jgi:hypothetical protein